MYHPGADPEPLFSPGDIAEAEANKDIWLIVTVTSFAPATGRLEFRASPSPPPRILSRFIPPLDPGFLCKTSNDYYFT